MISKDKFVTHGDSDYWSGGSPTNMEMTKNYFIETKFQVLAFYNDNSLALSAF